MEGTKEGMLINFDSPEKNSNAVIHNHYLKNPLIPGPDLHFNLLEGNNPFDVVAQTAENWDPFELVFHQSLRQSNSKDCLKNKEEIVKHEFLDKKNGSCRLNRSNSVSNNVKFFPTPDNYFDRSDTDLLNISSHSLDTSPSLRERIKRVVKKRVSKCIEMARNSTKCQLNHSDNVKSPKISPVKLSPKNKPEKRASEIKKEETDDYNLKNVLEEAKQLSVIFHNMSISEVSKKTPYQEQSFLFSKSLHSDKLQGSLKEEDDLMSIKPPWEDLDHNYSSESDDNSIGLPKVKLFYVKKKEKEKKDEMNQEKLAHYKKRIRASIDGNMFYEEVKTIEEAVLETPNCNDVMQIEKKPEEQPQTYCRVDEKKVLDVMVNKPIVSARNDLRLKKVGNILKKGPLKAIVPLQKMTKTIAEKISPLKKGSPSMRYQGRSKDDSSLSSSIIHPVASSTPNNKNLTYNPKNSVTPLCSKPRPRLSRKDNEPTEHIKRSISLSTSARISSQPKLPFTMINPNDNKKLKRPHTAPAPSPKTRLTPKSSPYKKNDGRKLYKLSTLDKENQKHPY